MHYRVMLTCLALALAMPLLVGCSSKRPKPISISPSYSYIRNALHTSSYETPQAPPTGQAIAER